MKTPQIDRIGREGVHFTNQFVVRSACSPSGTSGYDYWEARTTSAKHRYPRRIRPQRCEAIVANIDRLPSILEICGVKQVKPC